MPVISEALRGGGGALKVVWQEKREPLWFEFRVFLLLDWLPYQN